MIKPFLKRFIPITIFLVFALLFIAKLAGPSILRLYVESGNGNCSTVPILCMAPTGEIINPAIDQDFARGLTPYTFPKMVISAPRGFTVVQETIKKNKFMKKIDKPTGPIIYVLHESPNFFIKLFPQLVKQGVRDNHEFIKRLMYARTDEIRNLTDAFFVIMKSIFTPDLGDQKKVIMTNFQLGDKNGFINLNMTGIDNYFDCNIVDNADGFFKVYIKDKGAKLSLEKVFTIIAGITGKD